MFCRCRHLLDEGYNGWVISPQKTEYLKIWDSHSGYQTKPNKKTKKKDKKTKKHPKTPGSLLRVGSPSIQTESIEQKALRQEGLMAFARDAVSAGLKGTASSTVTSRMNSPISSSHKKSKRGGRT